MTENKMTKILVVDDNPQVCQRLSEMLKEEGYDVMSMESGEEAVKCLQEENFELAIVDLMMPGMDGIDLLKWVKKVKPETQIIMITAFATVENAVEGMKKGASDYITKPFKLNEVQVAVKKALEEAKFKKHLQDTAALSLGPQVIKAMSNPIRRGVIRILYEGRKAKFTELLQELRVGKPPKLSFHLRSLKSAGIIEQDSEKAYFLSPEGRRIANTLKGSEQI